LVAVFFAAEFTDTLAAMAKGANKAVDVRGMKAKKKGPTPAAKAKTLHPNSRKAGRLQRGVRPPPTPDAHHQP
jgi:hypothetical protein